MMIMQTIVVTVLVVSVAIIISLALLNIFNIESKRPLVSQRAYNRWRVAYTLIRNEQLLVRGITLM